MSKPLEVSKGEDGKWYVDRTRFDTAEEAYEFIQQIKSSKEKEAKPGIFTYLFTFGISIWIITSCFGPSSKLSSTATSSSTPPEISFAAALTKCQYALKGQSKDPDSAEVPYVNDFGSGKEFYFAWGASSKPVRMKNSYGAILSAGASCTVNKATGQITSLSLDGRTIQ
jgi:hypothetical protein